MIDFYSISFLITKTDLKLQEPYKIDLEHCIRRATKKEVSDIERLIIPYTRLSMDSSAYVSPYRLFRQEDRSIQELPESKWHYWVLENKKEHLPPPELINAFLLSNPELDFGPSISYKNSKLFGFSPPNYYDIHKLRGILFNIDDTVSISNDLLEFVSNCYLNIKDIGDRQPFITDAITRYRQSRSLVQGANLKIVGYFSVIELLITHSPRLNESLDSITHQLVSKIILLSKQYNNPVCPEDYFGSITTKKLWKKLYSFRSAIAHGGNAKFSEREFESLAGMKNVEEFLRENIKQLILLALIKPDFLIDLKEC